MAVRDRSIGSTGLEQGGPNLGNDYSRNITREHQDNETLKTVVQKHDKDEDEENEERENIEKRNQ